MQAQVEALTAANETERRERQALNAALHRKEEELGALTAALQAKQAELDEAQARTQREARAHALRLCPAPAPWSLGSRDAHCSQSRLCVPTDAHMRHG